MALQPHRVASTRRLAAGMLTCFSVSWCFLDFFFNTSLQGTASALRRIMRLCSCQNDQRQTKTLLLFLIFFFFKCIHNFCSTPPTATVLINNHPPTHTLTDINGVGRQNRTLGELCCVSMVIVSNDSLPEAATNPRLNK